MTKKQVKKYKELMDLPIETIEKMHDKDWKAQSIASNMVPYHLISPYELIRFGKTVFIGCVIIYGVNKICVTIDHMANRKENKA